MADQCDAAAAGTVFLGSKSPSLLGRDAKHVEKIGTDHLRGKTFRFTSAAKSQGGITDRADGVEGVRLVTPVLIILIRDRKDRKTGRVFREQDYARRIA